MKKNTKVPKSKSKQTVDTGGALAAMPFNTTGQPVPRLGWYAVRIIKTGEIDVMTQMSSGQWYSGERFYELHEVERVNNQNKKLFQDKDQLEWAASVNKKLEKLEDNSFSNFMLIGIGLICSLAAVSLALL